jgi:shikimate dehydrogenase
MVRMHEISGTTRLAGVIGHPLDHSLSPAMHNAAYGQLGLDWVYVPLEVRDEVGLRRLVAAIHSLDFVGFNVTMPFKRSVLELCDEVSATARMAGAVNTVHCSEGRLVGYNTDGRGLLESLELEAEFVPADKDIVILGAGGAAAAALVALILARASSVTVASRDLCRAEQLVDSMMAHAGGMRVMPVAIGEVEDAVRGADLVVNATPLGMQAGDPSPVSADWLRPGQVVYDMVYGNVEPTALVRESRSKGAVALDGLGMLVCQGATAVDIWNQDPEARTPRDIMRGAAEEALAARWGRS